MELLPGTGPVGAAQPGSGAGDERENRRPDLLELRNLRQEAGGAVLGGEVVLAALALGDVAMDRRPATIFPAAFSIGVAVTATSTWRPPLPTRS